MIKDRKGFPISPFRPCSRNPALPALTLAALAARSIALSALSLPLVVHLPSYYTGSLHLDLGIVGAVFMIVRIIDIGFDPLLGGWMDKTQTRFGRYRPWIAASAPMIMAGILMLFTASPGVSPVYLAIWLLIALWRLVCAGERWPGKTGHRDKWCRSLFRTTRPPLGETSNFSDR